MKRYRIYYWQHTSNCVEVEADTEAEARRMFDDEGPICGKYSIFDQEITDEGVSDIEQEGPEYCGNCGASDRTMSGTLCVPCHDHYIDDEDHYEKETHEQAAH